MKPYSELPSTGSNWLKTVRAFSKDSWSALKGWQKEYGDIFHMNLGIGSTHVCGHPDLIDEVLTKQKHNFRKGNIYSNILPKLGGYGLLNSDGELWRKQRRLAQPAFHKKYLSVIFTHMIAVVDKTLTDIYSRAQQNQQVAWNEEMINLTLQVVMQSLVGTEVKESTEKMHHMMDESLTHLLNLRFNPMYKYTQYITGKRSRFEQQRTYLYDIVMRIIQDRRASGNDDRWDLMAMFMKAIDEETQEQMTDEQLKDELITLFLAGHETSAAGLTWAMTFIGNRPDVLQNIREEADRVFTGELPTFEQLWQMTYTRSVIDESLRLKPPVWSIARHSINPIELGGFEFPNDLEFMLPIMLVHHHPDFWENPMEFQPERFIDGVPQEKRKAFIPFGAGPRMCIGNNFAYAEMIATLGLAAQRFDVQVDNPDIPGVATLSYRPGAKLWVKMKERATVV
ncbi:MAG: cytochrome P450 [Bacteroidota bacterium]